MSARGQSQSINQENKRPTAGSPPSSEPAPASRSSAQEEAANEADDSDFVDISDEDTDMRDADADDKQRTNLGLHRLAANSGSEDLDDDSEEEADSMASHPLLSMLTGRLGQRRRGSTHKWDSLHPVTSVLSVNNVQDCTELENQVFPENERCSREKFEYRLARCPELSLGLFSRPTAAEAAGQSEQPKRRLIAHVVATRSPAPSVTDASMALPSNWKQRKSSLPSPEDVGEPQGHQDMGGTICVHSLAVSKEHQGIGLGTVLMKAYVQRIKDSKVAERVALLAHEHLVSFYVGLGFQDMGPSNATFGGGNWNNLILEFTHDEED